MQGLDFSGYKVTSGTLDGNSPTSRLKPGTTYGHVIRTTQYFQLRPINIKIDSTLLDTKQLEFDSVGQTWQWRLHLDPFTDGQELIQVLKCHFPKSRLQDTISINVTEDDSGQFALLLDIA